MVRLGYVFPILTVLLFFASAYSSTIDNTELEVNDKQFSPSSSWGFQSGKSSSGLSSSSSSTQQAGESQTYSTSFSKSMDIESKHKEFNKLLPDTCSDWGYDFDSEIYVDYNLKVKHTGSTNVASSANGNDGLGDFTLTQTNVQSSYEVTVKPEIVFDYRLRVFETHNDCYWPFDDPTDYPDKIYSNTLRIPFPSTYQEYTGQTQLYIPYLGYVYLWDEDATVPGINQPSSTTGFMLDERISVSTIDIYPIIQYYFSRYTDPIDYWVDVEIPLRYNLDIEAQAQHAIEYAMSIEGGSFLDMNDPRYVYSSPSQTDVMRLSSDPQRIFGSDLTNPGTVASRQWAGDGEDVTITATPNLVYHIHAEISGSISVSMLVTTMSEWVTILDLGPYTLWSGSTHTDSYSKVTNLGPTIKFTYSPPEPLLGISEFELFGQNITPIVAVSGGSIIVCLVILLSMLIVSRTSRRITRHTRSMNSSLNSQRYGNVPSYSPPNLGPNNGNSLNWEDPFDPANNQMFNSNSNRSDSSTAGQIMSMWDVKTNQWNSFRIAKTHNDLPHGGNYGTDELGTHYYALDGGDWLMLEGGSFALQPNKVSLTNHQEFNYQSSEIGSQTSLINEEWMEWPITSGNWWYRENNLQEWNLWNPTVENNELDAVSSTFTESNSEIKEYPEGSGDWWNWNSVEGKWDYLENHSQDDVALTSESDAVVEYKEYPEGSGTWWSWDSLISEWVLYNPQPLEQENDYSVNDNEEISTGQQESNFVCWACVKPLEGAEWSYCTCCGARYHSTNSESCNFIHNVFVCLSCGQPANGFVNNIQ